MYIDTSHITRGGKTYTRHLLRESYRANGKVLHRTIANGSHCSAADVLGLGTFDEDALYENLDWLAGVQASVEDRLFAQRTQTKPVSLFLYDVTSSYLEGTHNELAAFGYNRDGKKGKLQIVIGLLCDEDGHPVSIEVFPGNTPDPRTVASQIEKLKGRFGVTAITFVGDRGMIKGQQVEDLAQHGFHYITAMTKPQIEKLLCTGTLQMDLFDQKLAEVLTEEGIRYVLRRNPLRAQEMRDTRHAKLATLQAQVAKQSQYLTDHPRANAQGALQKLVARAEKLRIAAGVELPLEERALKLTVNASAQQEAAKLDGCYVLKTDLPPAQAPKEMVHDRYQDLASVERAFRACKTVHLEVRPIFLRREARTRAQALVVMLAYQIIRYLASCWRPSDFTCAEGLHALTTLCLVEVAPPHAPSYHCIPTPRDAIARLLHSADIQLPKAFSLSGVRVSTKKKLQSERRLQ